MTVKGCRGRTRAAAAGRGDLRLTRAQSHSAVSSRSGGNRREGERIAISERRPGFPRSTTLVRKALLYANEMVPLQLDCARGNDLTDGDAPPARQRASRVTRTVERQ